MLLFFFLDGQLVNAAAIGSERRGPIAIAEGLRRVRAEQERSELCLRRRAAPSSSPGCTRPVPRGRSRGWSTRIHPGIFAALADERFSGVVEFISGGRVNYLLLSDGHFVSGSFCDRPEGLPVGRYMESLFAPLADGSAPALSVTIVSELDRIPVQASAAQLAAYREVHLRIGAAVEAEWPGEGRRRSDRTSFAVARTDPALGLLLDGASTAPVGTVELTQGLARWVRTLLQDVELVSPGAATRIVRDATHEHRYLLQAAGFYEQLPWRVEW